MSCVVTIGLQLVILQPVGRGDVRNHGGRAPLCGRRAVSEGSVTWRTTNEQYTWIPRHQGWQAGPRSIRPRCMERTNRSWLGLASLRQGQVSLPTPHLPTPDPHAHRLLRPRHLPWHSTVDRHWSWSGTWLGVWSGSLSLSSLGRHTKVPFT